MSRCAQTGLARQSAFHFRDVVPRAPARRGCFRSHARFSSLAYGHQPEAPQNRTVRRASRTARRIPPKPAISPTATRSAWRSFRVPLPSMPLPCWYLVKRFDCLVIQVAGTWRTIASLAFPRPSNDQDTRPSPTCSRSSLLFYHSPKQGRSRQSSDRHRTGCICRVVPSPDPVSKQSDPLAALTP